MVSYNKTLGTSSGLYIEGVCLTTDVKPVAGIANGSILSVLNAGTGEVKEFLFDQESASWIETAGLSDS